LHGGTLTLAVQYSHDIQKLYQSGNYISVNIPKMYLTDLKLLAGSEVVIYKRDDELILTTKKRALAKDINPEFVKSENEFIEEHQDTLEELAHR